MTWNYLGTIGPKHIVIDKQTNRYCICTKYLYTLYAIHTPAHTHP